jgi:uncharacterized membrane protein (UPF0182 family)
MLKRAAKFVLIALAVLFTVLMWSGISVREALRAIGF